MFEEHYEELQDRARQGRLGHAERALLDRHLATCESCADEADVGRYFADVTRSAAEDEALNHAAVARALGTLRAPAPLRTSRRLAWKAGLGVTAAAALCAGLWLTLRPAPVVVEVSHPSARRAPSANLVLNDGSEIAPETPDTHVQIHEQTSTRTTVELPTGRASFRVRHDIRRVFRVHAGAVDILDLGTEFRVSHGPGDVVHVVVTQGRVSVTSKAWHLATELGAGEERTFGPPAADTTTAAERPAPLAAPALEPPAPPTRAAARPHHADEAAELLLKADEARRSRKPDVALEPLRRFLGRYPKDPRAPSAAFTLGWLLLNDLHRSSDAALAFRQAERLAPPGALAEDAAARVAEAWQSAGDRGHAQEAARHYLAAYPDGRYVALMTDLIRQR